MTIGYSAGRLPWVMDDTQGFPTNTLDSRMDEPSEILSPPQAACVTAVTTAGQTRRLSRSGSSMISSAWPLHVIDACDTRTHTSLLSLLFFRLRAVLLIELDGSVPLRGEPRETLIQKYDSDTIDGHHDHCDHKRIDAAFRRSR